MPQENHNGVLPSFTLFGLTFYPYTLFLIAGVGVTVGLFAGLTVHRHRGLTGENSFAIEALLIALAAAFPAAMLLDALFKFAEYGEFVFGGATFYGGLLGALAIFLPILRFKKGRTVSVSERLSDLAPCIPAGHCLGRIGCFFGGCCYGKPTDCAFGVVFPEGSIPYEHYGGAVKIHPTQLYEAVFLLLLAFFLWRFAKKRAFPLYCILYGVFRFLIEFLRDDDRGALLPGLSPAQILSLLLVAVGAALLLFYAVRRTKKN